MLNLLIAVLYIFIVYPIMMVLYVLVLILRGINPRLINKRKRDNKK